jgi:hypothetical protein
MSKFSLVHEAIHHDASYEENCGGYDGPAHTDSGFKVRPFQTLRTSQKSERTRISCVHSCTRFGALKRTPVKAVIDRLRQTLTLDPSPARNPLVTARIKVPPGSKSGVIVALWTNTP